MMRRLALVFLALLVFTACGKNNSFQATDSPEFQVQGSGFIRIQMPATEERTRSQESLVLRNTGDGPLQVTSVEWIDRPERLVAIGDLPQNSSLGSCESDEDCGADEICLTSAQACNPTGLPDAFELGPQLRKDLDFAITIGGPEMTCPDEPSIEVPIDFQNDYCGAIRIETNADNDGDNVEDGQAIIYFLDPGASGQVEVEPSFLEFTNVQPGSTQSQTFSVTNSGMNPLEVLTMGVEDNPTFFTISAVDGSTLPLDIESGTAKQFEVVVDIPADQEDYETITILNIETSAGIEKISVEVTAAAGSAPIIELDSEVLRFDQSASQTLTVSNTGQATLQLTGLNVQPPTARDFYSFEVDGNDVTDNFQPVNVPKGQSKELVVNFARPGGNEDSSVGVLEIAHNDRNNGFKSEVTLLGDEGDVPIGQVRPEGFTFLAEDGNSATRAFVVRNIGTAALDLTGITWGTFSQGSNAEFQISPTSGTVPAGGILRFEASFTGMNAAPDVGVANFDSNNATDLSLSLRALDSATVVPTPVIEVTTQGTPQAGSPVNLSAASSTPDGIASNAVWTLLSRPASSSAWLNDVGDEASFVADQAGTYEVALTILNSDREAQVTQEITVE